jgi:hypothetical protein
MTKSVMLFVNNMQKLLNLGSGSGFDCFLAAKAVFDNEKILVRNIS